MSKEKNDEVIEIPEGTMVDIERNVLKSLPKKDKTAKDVEPVSEHERQDELKPRGTDKDIPAVADDEVPPTTMMEAPEETVLMNIPDFSGEKTPEPTSAKVICIFGNDKGREFELSQKTTLVGRGLECGVVVNDPSASRKHFNIIRTDHGYKLIDLGSGNGTKVQGQRVHEIDLEDGVRIELGTTVLQFVLDAEQTKILDEDKIVSLAGQGQTTEKPVSIRDQKPTQRSISSEALSQTSHDRPQKTSAEPLSVNEEIQAKRKITIMVYIIMAVIGLSSIGTGVYYLFTKKNNEENSQLEISKEEEKKQHKAKSEEFYRKGLMQFKDKQWDLALAEFKKADELYYDLDGLYESIKKAESEKEAEEFLQTGKAAFDRGVFSDAETNLSNISESSVYYVEANDILSKIKNSAFEEKVKKVRELFQSRKINEAKEEVQKLLEEQPENQSLLVLKKDMEKNGISFEPEKKEDAVEKKGTTVAYTKKFTEETEHSKLPRGGYENALTYYKSGNFGSASSVLRSLASKTNNRNEKEKYYQMADTVEDFGSSYINGKQNAKKYMYGKAVPDLMRALSLDKNISGYYQTELRTLLGEMYSYQSAKSFADKRYDEASALARKALALAPNDDTAKGVEKKVIEKAKVLFEEAKSKMAKNDGESARHLLRQVVKILPPSDPVYREAYKLLNELAGE